MDNRQIEDYIISEKDRLRLMNNETAGPFLFGGQHVFLQVDHDLNRIVVKSGHEINVPKKIAGYSLTAEDMNTLATGGKMKNHLFCIDGKYYTAEIGMTGDKRGLYFDRYKDQSHLSGAQLKKLEKVLNQPSSPVPPLELSPAMETVRSLKKEEFAKYVLNPAGNLPSGEGIFSRQQEIFRDAADHYNVNMLVHLKESGFKPDESDVGYIRNNINLDSEEKRIISTVLEVNLMEVAYDGHSRPDHIVHTRRTVHKDEENRGKDTGSQTQQPDQTENTEKNHFSAGGVSVKLEPARKDKPKTPEPAVTQKVGNMVTEAFSNM